MLLTLLSAGAELLIPLLAVGLSLSIPIIAIIYHYRDRSRIMEERKLMIEKGLAPPELSKHMASESKKRSPMSKGIDMLAVALGILSGYFAAQSWETNTPISIVCAILFWLGIANIAKAFILKDEIDTNE